MVFPGITVPAERAYIIHYWRFLLGWAAAPPTYGLPTSDRARLRSHLREIRRSIERKGKLLAWPIPKEPQNNE